MTVQEAIGYLKTLPNRIPLKFFTQNGEKVYDDFSKVAIEALEKQIPKKPSIEGDGEWEGQLVYDTWICPCCNKSYEIDYDDYKYCPNCGQRIDRSDLQ